MLGWDKSDNIEHLQAALAKLASTPVQFNLLHDGKVSWHTMALISYGKIENSVCSYSYAEFLAEQLYNPEMYATINLRVQRIFDSVYALALYENCLRFRNVGSTGWWPIETYRELVGATGKSYEEFRYLNRDAIRKPVNDINKNSDIRVKPEFKRSGRFVTHIRFQVSYAPQADAPSNRPAGNGARDDVRETDLFKRLRAHGIGERLAVTWIRQDESRARASVAYVEGKAKEKQIKGSTAGYLRTVFESDTDLGPSLFEKEKREEESAAKRMRDAEESAKRKAELKRQGERAKARAAMNALTQEEIRGYAREYMAGKGTGRCASWNEAKATFTNSLERLQFKGWLENHIKV